MDRLKAAEWIEWSGLPAQLNGVRAGAWPVLRKLIELDCERNREPAAVEVSPAELAERTGLDPDKVLKLIETLRKQKVVRCFVPEEAQEPGLFEVARPLPTPRSPEDVARAATDPQLRNVSAYRYLRAAETDPDLDRRMQQVADLYLNHVSQKMNSMVMEQIRMAAERFPVEKIDRIMQRASRHNLRAMGWVIKELIREEKKERAEQRRGG